MAASDGLGFDGLAAGGVLADLVVGISSSESGASSIESAWPSPSPPPLWRLIPESLGRERLIPESLGSAAVTSESLALASGVASNSSLASSALSSKSLPESGWSASISSLDGFSSKSLSDWLAGTSADEPSERADPHRAYRCPSRSRGCRDRPCLP